MRLSMLNRPNKKNNVLVFYDTWCPICTKSMKTLARLDCFRRLQYESTRNKAVLNEYSLNYEKLEKRMHTIRLKDGKIEEGIDSIFRIVKQIPLLWIAVPFLQLSIWIGVGSKIYDWLASKRKILPVGGCEGDFCRLPDRS
ncbi:thiol-disulfide oxidoreductase DCC family protein [Virgibacillus dokdonensis]